MAQEPENKTTRNRERSSSDTSSTQSRSSSRSEGGSSRSRYQARPRQQGQQQRRRYHRRKVCAYCVDKTKVINWKNVDDLRRFTSDSGSIFPRRKTGMCAKHQRSVAVAIKQARHIALLPYTTEHVRIMGKV